MRLILSSRHPKNSTYSTESGQLLYKVDTPMKLGNRTATIRKAVATVDGVWQGSNDSPRLSLTQSGEKSPFSDKYSSEKYDTVPIPEADRQSVDEVFIDSDDEDEVDGGGAGPSTLGLPELEGHFAFYAQIIFQTFQSSRFLLNSIETPVSDYFRKEGWSWFGRGRAFTASDGKEYRWELRISHLEMIRNDATKAQVVRFYPFRPAFGPISKGRAAYLEIDDSCKEILDEIILSFVYCHKLRKDRERRQRHSGGGGGP
ncbi:hypothetical protein NP233_g2959 [Leucocoprinus birnbaumii]|uniref:DUF6593 domain-containing protein n=1 Tax=Leucocoprinus birnbaumii TaxID=56174 RepID=A0AAD5YT83_9AGAR|nr:hypothetical protein NP233_g2959 [Leucocoprinus birnbaumii]